MKSEIVFALFLLVFPEQCLLSTTPEKRPSIDLLRNFVDVLRTSIRTCGAFLTLQ